MSHRSSTAPAAPEQSGNAVASAGNQATSADLRASGRLFISARWLFWGRIAWWNLVIPALIFITTWAPRNALVHSLDLVTDESVYIPTGINDLYLLRAGAMHNPYWLVNFEAPAFPKLLMGLGALYGSHHLGAQGWLYGARLPGVLLIALTLIASYFLARPIFGRAGAALGALTLALSPWLAFFNAIAYLDTYLLCFMTLAALVTWHAARRPWLWPLVGVLGGLAFASKYTAAFVAVPIIGYIVFYSIFIARRRPPWQIALIIPVGLLTTYIADPAIWVDPALRLWSSILFQYNHASSGHDAFWNGAVWQHVPPGIGIYILLAKMSMFVTIPAILALLWALWRLARASREHHPMTPLDDTAAFALLWLGGMLPLFASLNIIVGAHYVLPLAPPVAFTAGWAYIRAAHWLTPRLSAWMRASVGPALARFASAGRAARQISVSEPMASRLINGAFATLIAIAMFLPHAIGLATVNQAEGYTAGWLHGENASLQVAYPAYADAVNWIVAHSEGRTTVTLVMSEKGALDEWMNGANTPPDAAAKIMRPRQTLFPERIRLAVGTPSNFPHSQFIVWPEHLVQRQFPKPANFDQLIVKRIQGGPTTYCYILLWPNPDR